MSTGRVIPPATIARQMLASDPDLSAWVSANAGSGKTTVLTRRVIRLLLRGVPPQRILCLTFTKAAAANMQNRIFRDLGRWAMLPEPDLAREIKEMTGTPPDAALLRRARRLLADAVETPGGLKILTIHALCERVLHLFPFEANVPAQFTVLDEPGVAQLLDEARAAIILEANRVPDGPLGRAVTRALEEAGDEAFSTLLRAVADERDALNALLKTAEPAIVTRRAREALGLEPGETAASIEAAIDADGLAAAEWPAIAAALREVGSKKDADCADAFDRAAMAGGDERGALYRGIFLTKGKPRAPGFITNAVRVALPDLAQRLEAERQRVGALTEREKLARCAERTAALLVIAAAMLAHYQAGKRNRAALDFDDLVTRTLSLVQRAGAAWVLYKLDQGIDHILVDEAQDTSPVQWRIIEALAQEFTAGAGARLVHRTIFAVGDEKQSIFSFQGAAPEEFTTKRHHFARELNAADMRFEWVHLTHSFRSTPDVITAVDAVFDVEANRRGLSSDPAGEPHDTVRAGEPGRVEIWPVETPEAVPEIEAWDAPFDETSPSSPPVKLARRIAAVVGQLVRGGDPATGARYHAGDVMVLVRSRNAMFEAVIRALKVEGVPVAGADRLVLMDHIAVMDLVALGRFILLPTDDLMLATVLKTPLIGLDDDDLMRLAPGRAGSLWEALGRAAGTDARFAGAHRRLTRWIDEAAFATPFAFYADVLARDAGRRAFLARLGMEAADALDEFLNAAATHATTATPTLEGFLAWLSGARTEVKRDMDIARGEVRVMTTHGAKGLEAKIVVMADTCSAPSGRHDPKLFFVDAPRAVPGAPPLVFWSPKKDEDPPLVTTARDRAHAEAAAEHRRLLYVAMTRAEDRLIVTGYQGTTARPADNWYDMIAGALRDAGALSEPMPDGEGERLIWEKTPRVAVAAKAEAPKAPTRAAPAWAGVPAPMETPASVRLRPSDALGAGETADAPAMRGVAPGAGQAIERGKLIHRLLQALPGLVPEERAAAARHYLARTFAGDEPAHDGLIAEVMAVIDDPALAAAFASGARPEVEIAGRLPRAGRPDYLVAGRIDRLSIGEEQILLVDFKTNRRPPETLEAVPESYVAQFSVYRALLQKLYPGRSIRAVLIWTAGPSLTELPEAMLDAALARILGV